MKKTGSVRDLTHSHPYVHFKKLMLKKQFNLNAYIIPVITYMYKKFYKAFAYSFSHLILQNSIKKDNASLLISVLYIRKTSSEM